MKVVALTTVSGPYVVARYSAFAKSFPEISFVLLELGRVSAIYPWDCALKTSYQRIILSEQPAETQSSLGLFQRINHALTEIQPDVIIICGYNVPGMREALLWSLWHNRPTVLLSETKVDDAHRNWWREILKSLIVKRYKAALVGGQSHKRYLMQLGMSPEAIFLGYDVVGNDSFHPNQIRHLNIPLKKLYFLSINRFIPKKNLGFLLSSYAAYRRIMGDASWDLVICGDGELRPQLEQQITKLVLNEYVHLPGFLQQDQLLPYFAHAGCLIHSSIQEQWGLVVNEAMATGLPVLVSKCCGCFEDLVLEGINGFSFDPKNQQELTQLMVKISSGETDLQKMGQASLRHIQNFSPARFAQGLMQAIHYALAHR